VDSGSDGALRYLFIPIAILLFQANGARACAKYFSQDFKVPKTLVAKVEETATPLTSKAILSGPEKILYMGEDHPDMAPKKLVVRLIPDLKTYGFGRIGLEAFNSFRQPLLDAYFDGTAEIGDIEKALREDWNWNPSGFLEIIKAAKEYGIRVIALDGRDKSTSRMTFEEEMEMRDQYMARRVVDQVEQFPEEKILVLIGSYHIDAARKKSGRARGWQPKILAREYGLATRTIGVDYPGKAVSSFVRSAVREAGLSTEWLWVPTSRDEEGFDAYLFLDTIQESRPGYYLHDTFELKIP
jgi:hypothetical protein